MTNTILHSKSQISRSKNCQRAISCQGWQTCECMMEASDCAKIYDLSGEATVCNVMVVRALPPPFPMQCSVSVNGSTTAIWAHNYHVPGNVRKNTDKETLLLRPG
ncbi:hypothetical protein CDAR_180401 [Caerostris darwini]|uniref:Uncharacterized protein n=1 Tax=Caerostris darwini TaxID=1538125 RepID=A0AAV4NS87_9ARAC|nr:hypothetical protein CDAR_180401 [Caerostris darwini]